MYTPEPARPSDGDRTRWTFPPQDPLIPTKYFAKESIRLPDLCRQVRKRCDWFDAERASWILNALGEPVLPHPEDELAAVRVVYYHDHIVRPRVAVRVVRQGQTVTALAKTMESLEQNDEGRLMWIRTRALTMLDWHRIVNEIEARHLWKAPTISMAEIEKRQTHSCMHSVCYAVELVRGSEQRLLYDCPCLGGDRTERLAEMLADLAKCSAPSEPSTSRPAR
jgi:hypothetical protein